MNYVDLLKLGAPEAIVVVSALIVLALGLTNPKNTAPLFVALAGLALSVASVLYLPANANPFGGMLVISPLNSLFKIICLILAIFTVALVQSEAMRPHRAEYLALFLF